MEIQTDQRLNAVLRDAIAERGLSVKRLSEQTGIAERHLESLVKGAYDKLPAAPYVRGYLGKIAPLLGIESQELWRLYCAELEPKSSGPQDRLPSNRYVIRQTVSRRAVVIAVVAVLLALYLGTNLGRLMGEPLLRITNPVAETTVIATSTILLTGQVNPRDEFLIDGEEAHADPSGNFKQSYTLQPGLNTVTFTARRLLGKEVTHTRQIIYQP